MLPTLILILMLACGAEPNAGAPIVLNDDGGWCWFQDERALIVGGQLVVASVANGRSDPLRRGDVEIVVHDLRNGRSTRVELHDRLNADDHAEPALALLPDGRLLAMYSTHGADARIYCRTTRQAGDCASWAEERVIVPSASSRVTYSNLHFLSAEKRGPGRLYNFFRGLDDHFKPSWMFSDDSGENWRTGGLLVDLSSSRRHRPYAKYTSNERDEIHVVFTEGHPRDFDNSLYHVVLKEGWFCRSDGSQVREMVRGSIEPHEATRIFAGDPNHVAWPHDLHLDKQGRPVVAYSVQVNSAGLPPGQGGDDHRYRYARWDGKQWLDREIAFAGRRLYAGEDDYTGGIALDPDDLQRVFISTSVAPADGKALASGRFELFAGVAEKPDTGWSWTRMASHPEQDQLRPIVPRGGSQGTMLLWLRGSYRSFTSYDLEVVGRRVD